MILILYNCIPTTFMTYLVRDQVQLPPSKIHEVFFCLLDLIKYVAVMRDNYLISRNQIKSLIATESLDRHFSSLCVLEALIR